MAQNQIFYPLKWASKAISKVKNAARRRHRGWEASTPAIQNEDFFSIDDADVQVSLRRRRDSVDSSLTYIGPESDAEHNETCRQTRLITEFEQKFLWQCDRPRAADLCHRCSRINFDAIYNDHETTLGVSTAFSLQHIGVIDGTWTQRSCRVCKILASIWRSNKYYLRSQSLCLVLLSSRNISKYAESLQFPETTHQHNILVLSQLQTQRVFVVDPTTLENLDVVGPLFLARRNVDADQCISVRPIKPDRIEFSVVRGWLELCSENHGGSCSSSKETSIPGLQLLNCKTKRLEPYVAGTRYIALSYVWGTNANEQMHQTNEQMLSILPRTIADACKVTLELGLEYLWVDRYCIPQFDNRLKHIQIALMDLVYNCATLTIVAACGQDATFGLPGVSRRRFSQPSITVGEYEIVSALSYPLRDVRNSKWMSQQIYFECGGATFMETIAEPEVVMLLQADSAKCETQYGKIGTLQDTRHRLFPADYLNQINTDPWLIQHRMAEYTARSLTFESDTLNAFLGALRYFKNPECSKSHVWGVPVLWSSANWTPMGGFATGLCWNGIFPTTKAIKRRIGFSSWSWTGWQMPISPKSYFYRYKFKTPYETMSEAEQPMLSQYLHIEGWSLKCHLHTYSSTTLNVDAPLIWHWSLTPEGGFSKLYKVVIHKQYSNEEWRVREEKVFDILIIGNSENAVAAKSEFYDEFPPFGPFLMILENMGHHYERIGYADLAHSDVDAGRDMSNYLIGKKRRSFRLG